MAQLTIQQAFELALQHHHAGRLQEAEQLYRQILAQQPNHPDALHYLGVIAHQVGQHDAAVELIRRALALNPRNAAAHGSLGNVLKAKGSLEEAIAAYHDAIALNANYAEAHYALGLALKANGNIVEAIAAYRRATAIKPAYALAQRELGNALREAGLLDEAIAAYRHAAVLDPRSVEVHYNLGNALRDQGQLDEALAAYRRAAEIDPNLPQVQTNLGNALRETGRLHEAIAAYQRVVALKPDDAKAFSNLGNALKDAGQLDEAITAQRRAIALKPNFPEALNNLGAALCEKGEVDEAIAANRQAIAHNPNLPEALNNLGNAQKAAGRLDEAIAMYRLALAVNRADASIDSNLIYTLHFHPAYDAEAIAEEIRRWSRQHAEPLQGFIKPHSNDRNPDRRLRIGYVSPDFRGHSAALFVHPLLQAHDRAAFEIHCFSIARSPDDMTRRLAALADHWHDATPLSDAQFAECIEDHGIDILVDLTLHMASNRLLVFPRKPAPVQVTWLGYPGSTGLSTIDYRLSDPYLDPAGMDESIYTEKTIRLPDTFWCYDPLDGRDIAVNSLPALQNGVVTFGCLNNFCKVNDQVLGLWSRVLQQVQNARLLLLSPMGSHRRQLLDRLAGEGIDPTRIEFVARQPRRAYLELYHRIDLGLDTFPYNGHTTSLDSFWMGVPVVTLVGQTAVSRAGWCQLSNLGLMDLAAQSAEQFVTIAAELANDAPRLQQLRSTLRTRMERSPLMDAPRFARNIEAAYRRMWRAWCNATGKPAEQ